MKGSDGPGFIGSIRSLRDIAHKASIVIYVCAALASCGEPTQPVGQRNFRDTCQTDLDCTAPYRCDPGVGECRYLGASSPLRDESTEDGDKDSLEKALDKDMDIGKEFR